MNKLLGLPPFDEQWHLPQDALLSDLTTDVVERYVGERRKQGMAKNSIRTELARIWAVYHQIHKRYAAATDIDWPMPRAFKKTRYLSDDEEQEVLDCWRYRRLQSRH